MWTAASTQLISNLSSMYEYILTHLPNKSSFRFVDTISLLNADGVRGDYTLRKDAFFYEDHFVGNPVTPGVIITEIMIQIGLGVLGIFLTLNNEGTNASEQERLFPLLTSSEVSFYKMVLPGQKVTVISNKKYYRLGKLKCDVEMLDETNSLVARGTFSGVIKASINN